MTAQTAGCDRVSLRMKIGYAFGDFGANFVFQTVTLFLLFYFTDVMLIGASTAGMIILAAKLWDAVFDPMVGILCDKTHSRWGSKRVYLLFASVPLAVAFFLLFAGPNIPAAMRPVYGVVTFILFCTLYALVNVPYGALTAAMTTDMHERSSITAFRMTFALMGSLIVAGITPVLAKSFGTPIESYRMIGMIYGACAAVFTLVAFATVRERVVSKEKPVRHSFREELEVLKTNRAFQILSLSTLMQFTAINILAAMVNYYFKYFFPHEEFKPIAFLCLFVTSIVAMPAWVIISKKTSKSTGLIIGTLVLIVSLSALFFVQTFNAPLIAAILVVAGFGLSTVYLSPWAMIPDTVEYSEWKTGLRREGVLYGFFYFAQKLAVALAAFITGMGLSVSGYIANAAQSGSSLLGIRLLTTLIPISIFIISILIIRFYPIDAELHARMCREIAAKNNDK